MSFELGISMTRQAIWIGITIAVFFIGVGVTSTILSATYNPNTMKFANQELFEQMMSQNPKMTAKWLDTTMGSEMREKPMMSDMSFNVNAPITIPMIDGYYNGEKVFFLHTEVSDKPMAEMMTMMVNFPTLYVPELMNISPDDLGKVYIFTNGIPGTEPYGGGPFFFQIDIFDAIPGQEGYSQFRTPHLVTWSENSSPRLLTSVEDLLEAEANGEVSIKKTDLAVNAPMIVWKSDGMEKTASMIQRMFESRPGVDGEVTDVDVDNYIVMLKLLSKNNMGMTDSKMMNP